MNKIISIFLVVVAVAMTGCSLTGSSSSKDPVGAVSQPMPTGNANLKFALEVPNTNIAPSLRAVSNSARVHVSLNIVINSVVSVVRRVVPVVNGSATFNFNGLPAGSTLGEIHIEGGNVGGYQNFHGALDLGEGDNTLHASPVGSGMESDILATVFNNVIRNTAMVKTRTKNIIALITQVTHENGLATQTSNIFEKLVERVKPVGTVIARPSADLTYIIAYNSTGSQIWSASPTTLLKDVAVLGSALSTLKYSYTIQQGFDSSIIIAWKDENSNFFVATKLNKETGALENYLINRGMCYEHLITQNSQIILGGYYAPKKCPIVMMWAGNTNADSGATDASSTQGLAWIKAFTNFALTGAEPTVKHLSFGAFSGLTAIIEDAANHRARHIVMSLTDGSYTLPAIAQKFNINAIPGFKQNTLVWQQTDGSSYKLYWSLTHGVATATADVIASVTAPYVNSGLTNGTTVYYLLQETDSTGKVSYSYEVVATPDESLNLQPRIGINSPIDGQSFLTGGASITVSVYASDPDGYVASLSLILDGSVVGNLASAPYSFTLGNLQAGNHVLRAIAEDNNGAIKSTQPITFKVITNVTGDDFTNKITGHLKGDNTRAPISGALVGIAGTTIHAITDSTGYFALDHLAPGIYTIVIQRDGYAKRTIPGIRVE